MKVLIAGDSFATRSSTIHDNVGWATRIAQQHEVTNVAQAGVSEYKIIKQLHAQNLNEYDAIIVSHTSPNRVHVKHHPLHAESKTHYACDLIYRDLEESDSDHPTVKAGLAYFQHVFDPDYYLDIYCMMLSTCNHMTKHRPTLHVTFFNNNLDTPFEHFQCLYNVYRKHPGSVNHLNRIGNAAAHRIIDSWLQNRVY